MGALFVRGIVLFWLIAGFDLPRSGETEAAERRKQLTAWPILELGLYSFDRGNRPGSALICEGDAHGFETV